MIGEAIGAAAGSALAARAGLPWPEGDSPGLENASGQAGSSADLLRTQGTRLEGAASSAVGWQGQAAGAFQAAAGEERAAMVRAAAKLEDAAAALKRLSGTVRDAQELVQKLAREVIEADEEAERAAGRAALAEAWSIAAGARLALAGPDPSPSLEAADRDASADASAASSVASNAAEHARAVRERNTRLAQEACDQVLREDRTTAAAVDAAAGAAPLNGIPVSSPTPAAKFAQVALGGLSMDQWRAIAYWRAGIDGQAWNPYDGLLANDATVQSVYRYYGSLFLEHPEFQWAGMANVVGPMFYAGWQDMYVVRHVADDGQRIKYLSELMGLPTLPGVAYDIADWGALPPITPVGLAEHLTSEEIEWYEDHFLTMQRAIFDDLAWQHEAFALGGIGLMRELRQNGVIETRNLQAWESISTGTPEGVADGNAMLLNREQFDVIQKHYDEMRAHHGPVGDVATYAFSTMAENPIPGGHAYRDYNPITVEIDPTPTIPVIGWDPPGPEAHISLPLPDGNLANFDDRWAWIDDDMLPAYRSLLQDPGAANAIVQVPVADRAEAFRKLPDLRYPGGP